ncbi:MAG: virulence RhuM family protein, partial [Dysgonamonadaceae bacterium]|nr:virulence RhuM family protein [Dysgonamonadaceae bacterium]
MNNEYTYQLPGSNIQLEVLLEDESVWMTIDQMATLYNKSRATVNEHILNIFKDDELVRENVMRKIGNSDFSTKPTNYYNFDLILSLGYRIKSPQTAPFRAWATDRIAEEKSIQVSVIQENTDIVFYSDPDGKLHIELTYDGDTFWTTQRRMGELFNVETHTINYHLQQIFDSKELNRYSVIRKIRITAPDGKQYDTMFYNLDAIIAVGYRVN